MRKWFLVAALVLVACGNDKTLVKHIAPYHALIRKDVWGYPQIYPAGSFMVTGGSERRQTGTHYTPKLLTEQIVTETLEPLVWNETVSAESLFSASSKESRVRVLAS